MNWQEVCDDPSLQDLPFKIELNQHGEVIMNAVRVKHSLYVEKILLLLKAFLPNGSAPRRSLRSGPMMAYARRMSFGSPGSG